MSALAQSAGTEEATAGGEASFDLPAVTVTTASPVVKAKPKAKRKSAAPAPSSVVQAPVEETAAPELQPLPGSIVDAETFASVSVATAREFEAVGGATITDTLQHKPGVTGSTFAPGANRPIIRGLDSYRVRTQENGIGTHDVAAISEDHAVPIDPLGVDRVEVVRGPATLRYGSQAIGGVVAAENERIPTYMPPGGLKTRIVGGVSSVDEGADGAVSVTAGTAGVVIHADGFKRSAQDYSSPHGRVHNSFVESEGASVGASLIGTDGFFGVSYTHFASVYGVPGWEADEGVDPRIDMEQNKFMAKGEWRVRNSGIDTVRFWFGASDYKHSEFARHAHDDDHDHDDDDHGHDHDEDGITPFSLGSRFLNRQQEGRIEVQHLPFVSALGEFSGAIGIHVDNRRTRGTSFEGESLLEPVHTTSVAAFWFEELAVTRQLTLQAAARIEHTTVDGTGWEDFHGHLHGDHGHFHAHTFSGEREYTPVSASVGMLYKLPFDTVARLTGSYVERAPDAAELFSKGMHEATGTFEVGNPFLDLEKATTAEIGLKKATGAFRFDASAYYTRYNGFIYRALQGLQCDPVMSGGEFNCVAGGGGHHHDDDDHGHDHGGHMFDLVYFQQRDATFYGAELALQYDVAPIWNGIWGVDGQYDFVRARFAGGENVPRIAPHRLGGGVYYHDANWFARVGLLHAFDQNEIGLNELETPRYTLVNAEISFTTTIDVSARGATKLTLGVRGENLADQDILNHSSFKRREEVYLPGASVRAFGVISFN
ncbi:TonB-dependent receptor [Hyphomicrobium sulfonivorans]|uniref:TonB-dependent receptor n=1 Tax=Hyphomicrobium sulfonivorans TaxID=121290 RepID=UPI001FDAC38C|nr:TonB-dependent receptor [Hyphomicrobium sulfonivorans]